MGGFINLNSLANSASMALLFVYLMVALSVLVFRKTNSEFKREFKVPFGPVIPIIAIICCLFLMINLSLMTWVYFIAFLIFAILFYFAYSRKHSKLIK